VPRRWVGAAAFTGRLSVGASAGGKRIALMDAPRSLTLRLVCCCLSPCCWALSPDVPPISTAAPLQAESSSKLKALEQQLVRLRQQHDKAMKAVEARHKKEAEDETMRTAKVCRRLLTRCGCWFGGSGCATCSLACVLWSLQHRGRQDTCPVINCIYSNNVFPTPHPQNLDKEKEEQRKLQSELAEQKKAVAAAEAEKEKVGVGAGIVCGAACYRLT